MLFAPWSRHRNCSVFSRYDLAPGSRVSGPAVIEEAESTTVIGPGGEAIIDGSGNLVIRFKGKGAR
jgi:N-methylhydantoinase A